LRFDERNINRDPNPEFYQSMQDLLNRANIPDHEYANIHTVQFGSYYLYDGLLVLQESEGFNFVTCYTSGTFWSIAELFQRPYQPLVWACVGVTLLVTVIVLVAAKLMSKLKFYTFRLVVHILFNLLEIGVSPGNIRGRVSGFKIIFTSWLLMGIILTNAYKGLIISYLSVPWAPRQDYNYFSQIENFSFYAHIPNPL